MKTHLTSMMLALFMGATIALPANAEELKTEKEKLSYVLGAQLGEQFKRDGIEVEKEALFKGMEDSMQGKPLQLNQQQMVEVVQSFQKKQQEAQAKKQSANLEKGKAFLASNKDKEGVKTTDSGLQYKVNEAGSGKSPKVEDTVSVHYTGTLIDGTVFDSSVQRGQPAEFQLNRVIKGWTEGLQLMKEGGKSTFYIPSELAYGAGGSGKIGPNETLIFEVELLKIVE